MALSDVHDFLAFAHFLPILMGTFFAIRICFLIDTSLSVSWEKEKKNDVKVGLIWSLLQWRDLQILGLQVPPWKVTPV